MRVRVTVSDQNVQKVNTHTLTPSKILDGRVICQAAPNSKLQQSSFNATIGCTSGEV